MNSMCSSVGTDRRLLRQFSFNIFHLQHQLLTLILLAFQFGFDLLEL
ncbi:MAG: hypothetical protein LPK07_04950 [Hymenobacteraceae bacterium]|nr:hypothetical protein [Hymenobacteraceae bacterium]